MKICFIIGRVSSNIGVERFESVFEHAMFINCGLTCNVPNMVLLTELAGHQWGRDSVARTDSSALEGAEEVAIVCRASTIIT